LYLQQKEQFNIWFEIISHKNLYLKDKDVLNRFEKLWKEEVKRKGLKGASVLFTVMRMVRRRMVVAALFGIILNSALLIRSVSIYAAYRLISILEVDCIYDIQS